MASSLLHNRVVLAHPHGPWRHLPELQDNCRGSCLALVRIPLCDLGRHVGKRVSVDSSPDT
eukprot:6788444-Prymnesium_polylepis.1